MKKNLLTLTMFTVICFIGKAQVGINQDNPKADLDINAAATPTYAEGLLLPKVSIEDLNGMSNRYTEKQDGILVNVDTAPRDPITDPKLSTDKINKKGVYFYNSTTKMWEGFSANLGNGSFTPVTTKSKIVPISNEINWEQIVKESPDSNYFELVTESGASIKSGQNFPAPSLFKNKTIYIRNNTGKSIVFNFEETDFPKETDPETQVERNNIALGNREAFINIFGTNGYQFYSDGTRWYAMSSQYGS